MSEPVCPFCGKGIEHDGIVYCKHNIDGEYDIYYISRQNGKPATVVYPAFDKYENHPQIDQMTSILTLPGVDRALTKEAIERLLLLT